MQLSTRIQTAFAQAHILANASTIHAAARGKKPATLRLEGAPERALNVVAALVPWTLLYTTAEVVDGQVVVTSTR